MVYFFGIWFCDCRNRSGFDDFVPFIFNTSYGDFIALAGCVWMQTQRLSVNPREKKCIVSEYDENGNQRRLQYEFFLENSCVGYMCTALLL